MVFQGKFWTKRALSDAIVRTSQAAAPFLILSLPMILNSILNVAKIDRRQLDVTNHI